MQRLVIAFLFVFASTIVACGPPGGEGEGEGEAPTFTRVKDEIFRPTCSSTGCHTGSDPEAQLNLDETILAVSDLVDVDVPDDSPNAGSKYVVAGDAENSLLYQVLLGPVGDQTRRMPNDDTNTTNDPDVIGDELPDAEKDLLRDWIEAGALDD